MKKLTIFGKEYVIIERKNHDNSVKIEDNRIIIPHSKEPCYTQLKEALSELLYSQLLDILDSIKRAGAVEVFGDLDFEIVEKIDKHPQRMAKLKGNRILIKLSAVVLPKQVLRYIIAHELGHIATRRHNSKFWNIVKLMCPNFREAKHLLERYKDKIQKFERELKLPQIPML